MTPLLALWALALPLAEASARCAGHDLAGALPQNARLFARVPTEDVAAIVAAGTASLRGPHGVLVPARADPVPVIGAHTLLLYTPRAPLDPALAWRPGWTPPDTTAWRPIPGAAPFRRSQPPEVAAPAWSDLEIVARPGPHIEAMLTGVRDASPLTLEAWIETVGRDDVRVWGRWLLGRTSGDVTVPLAGGPCAPPFPPGFPPGTEVRVTLVLVDVVGVGSVIRTERFVVPAAE